MLHREIITIFSAIRTKHINTISYGHEETPRFCKISLCLSLTLLTSNVNYSGRTAPLTSKVAFYIFIQQI